MSEAVETARQMKRIIEALKVEGSKSTELIEAKARTTMAYKVARATEAVRAKDGGMAVTMLKHHAEGAASEEEYAMIVAVESLKAHWIRMENLRSQLNAYQSINRHLSVS
jgi:hypothetical protein